MMGNNDDDDDDDTTDIADIRSLCHAMANTDVEYDIHRLYICYANGTSSCNTI